VALSNLYILEFGCSFVSYSTIFKQSSLLFTVGFEVVAIFNLYSSEVAKWISEGFCILFDFEDWADFFECLDFG